MTDSAPRATADETSNADEIVRVELGDRAYDIVVGRGLIGRAGEIVAPLLSQPRTVIVADRNVASHWLAPMKDSLAAAGVESIDIVLDPGEATKSFAQLENLTTRLLEWRVERRSTVIALGGGVIGDLVGFAAAIVMRGIEFIQVPTTLLAQVDSAVGGKTAINSPLGKNLIGAFHQPRLVLSDTATLDTLPAREVGAGYAEVVKYGLIGDAAFFEWLEAEGQGVFSGDETIRRRAIAESCRAKARVVAADEREGGVRALLNLGHTFAHAFEAEAGYDGGLLHGEAVAIGMVQAFRLSEALGHCPAGAADRIEAHFRAVGVPTTLTGIANQSWTADALLHHMSLDKKVQDGRLTFILAHAIGDAFVSRDVEQAAVRDILQRALSDA